MGIRRSAAVFAAVLLAGGPASAFDRPEMLSRVAAVYARHPVDVRCPSAEEWSKDLNGAGVWSYANIRRGYMSLRPSVCSGALRVADSEVPAWQRAAGVLALVHESYHLRRWRHRRDEGRVSCAAIRQFTFAAELLGASPVTANDLLPFALALHLRTVQQFPLYQSTSCRLPIWTPPE